MAPTAAVNGIGRRQAFPKTVTVSNPWGGEGTGNG